MHFAIAFAVTTVATPLVGFVATRTGFVDRPDRPELKIHSRPIPLSGGIAVLLGTMTATTLLGTSSWWIVIGASAALAVGALDDHRDLSPITRIVALLGIAIGVAIYVSRGLEFAAWLAASLPLVFLATANAVNITDGQDGLAAGLAAIAAGALGFVASRGTGEEIVFGAYALSGALGGFLVWNRPKAAVFLGDNGAYAVGAYLALITVAVVADTGWRGAVAAALCLSPFACELIFTVVRRLRSSGSVTQGDRGHSYDLLALKIGRARSTLAFWATGAVAASVGCLVASA